MAEFAYNNAKSANSGYMFFELNCRYYLRVFYKENLDPHSPSKPVKELSSKLQSLIAAY